MGHRKRIVDGRLKSEMLPHDARNLLMAAASVDAGEPLGESFPRSCALEKAIDSVKRKYPQFFKPEGETEC